MPARTRQSLACPCPNKLENDTVCANHKVTILKSLFKDIKVQKLVATNKGRLCDHLGGCTNGARVKGKCYRHSGLYGCKYPGCTKLRQDRMYCKTHGGKHRNSKCKHVDCTKFSQGGGYCYKHGGGHRCRLDCCSESAHSSACKVCNKHIREIPTFELVDLIKSKEI